MIHESFCNFLSILSPPSCPWPKVRNPKLSAPRSETITRETLKLRRFLRRNAVPIGLPFGQQKPNGWMEGSLGKVVL